ncbi:MAG: hypothetical protein E7649_03525 [Ruminococcaceae bacterium]|nr:hypothetical protein [Oscillospiraceae bacterium]
MKSSFDFRRFLSVLVALLLVVTLVCATGCSLFEKSKDRDKDDDEKEDKADEDEGDADFIDGIGGVSETYKGSVSNESYNSAEDAAMAFVEVEVAGDSYVSSINVTSEGELSNKEIEKLDLPQDVQEGMVSVEKLEVEYSLEDESLCANGIVELSADKTDKLDKTKKVTVYVIKYEYDWKYFTPAPITGDTITKSYYDSVFNAEQYKNCTFSNTSMVKAKMTGSGEGETFNTTMETTVTQLIKHADNKIYMEQTIKSVMDGETDTQILYAYMEEVNGEVVCYVKTDANGDWYEGDLYTIGFSSIEELTPFYNQYLDYTYFTKTNYGFALEDENAEQYMNEALSGMSGLGGMFEGMNMDIDMFAEYYVSQGVLSGIRMDADINMSMSEGGVSMKIEETVTGNTTCTDYGTTVVEKPFEE